MTLLLVGTGQMGQVVKQQWQSAGLGPILPIDRSSSEGDWERAAAADVIIDFSSAEIVERVCKLACKYKKPWICGTTGWRDLKLKLHREVTCAQIPCLPSPNFSPGVCALRRAVRQIAQLMPLLNPSDVKICETHHRDKRDAPSGTALLLAEDLQLSETNTLIESLRADDHFGTHTVRLRTPWESLELRHTAQNRLGFARGAIAAARWLYRQPAGWYTMEDFVADWIDTDNSQESIGR